MTNVPERGRLEETSLPRLLLDLERARFGGALVLARPRVEKRFLFHQGRPVYSESNLASETLSLQLLEAGRLTREDYARVVASVSRERCKEGAALLELSLVDARELFDALRDQVRLRLLECFGWPAGEFRLDASAPPPADAQALRSDPVALIQAGIATHWDAERILGELASAMARYARRSPRFDELAARLPRHASIDELLAGLDGEHTLWQALHGARSPQALAAAWLLVHAGGLELAEAPRTAAAAGPEIELVVAATPSAAPERGAPRPSRAEPDATAARAAARLRSEIDGKFERLGRIDHYELLGQSRSALTAALKQAYHRAAKTYHPDALARAGLDEETRRRATRVFAAISTAFAVLADPERRRAYDASLAGDREALDADRVANAETNYRKGEILVRQGNFRAAVDYLRAAVELWPEEAEYQSALGWALFKKTPSEPKAARDHLERARMLAPHDATVQTRYSAVLRDLDEIA